MEMYGVAITETDSLERDVSADISVNLSNSIVGNSSHGNH
jgi:hypothetical protein